MHCDLHKLHSRSQPVYTLGACHRLRRGAFVKDGTTAHNNGAVSSLNKKEKKTSPIISPSLIHSPPLSLPPDDSAPRGLKEKKVIL